MEDGEIGECLETCTRCKGTGLIYSQEEASKKGIDTLQNLCRKCWGRKKITWTQNIMGIPRPAFGDPIELQGFAGTSGTSRILWKKDDEGVWRTNGVYKRKVYIDCGTWTGDSIRAFKKYVYDYDKYEIYAFECHPDLKKCLNELKKEINFEFIDKAVSTKNEIIPFYTGTDGLTQSSTTISTKRKYINIKQKVDVQSIDLSQWILDTFNKTDYIMLKMNIEGAEYDVLEKMFDDGSIDYVQKLLVAWHYNKLKGFPKIRHDKLFEKLKSKVYQFSTWSYEEDKDKNPFI